MKTALLALALCAAVAHAEVPVHTFSIVARDSVTGDMGVAVQSHYFAVGPVVPCGRAVSLAWRHAASRSSQVHSHIRS